MQKKTILTVIIGFAILFLFASGINVGKDYKKYDIESGMIRYEMTNSLIGKKIKKLYYFTNYGATEYIEAIDEEKPRQVSILKQDDVEYLLLSDSLAIKNTRGYDDVFEKCVFRKESKLYISDFSYKKVSDTLYLSTKCEVFTFKIASIAHIGRAVVWKRIPLLIHSEVQGIEETIKVTAIDTATPIPTAKKKLASYVHFE